MTKNEIYDKKLLDKGIKYRRIGDYTIQTDEILHECLTCGTVSLKAPKRILAGRGCKVCAVASSTSSEATYDSRIKDTTFTRIDPYVNALTEILHECKVCSARYLVRPASVVSGHGCKYCTNRARRTIKQYKEDIADRNISVSGEYLGNKVKLLHTCDTCNSTWEATPNNVVSKESGCPVCAANSTVSKAELELREFISANYTGDIIFNDRTILEGKELDIVLPDIGIAIEYNGVYWHNSEAVGKSFHVDKTDKVQEFGYQLIHVFEDKWKLKKDIVKSRLLNILGKSSRIFARNCIIKEVPNYTEFLDTNHIQGSTIAKYSYGLYYKDDLVAIMTFGTPRFTDTHDYELIRYCSKLGTTVIGGASKLLKHFQKLHAGTIVSYSDRCWSSGKLYKTLGFTYSHTSTPNYRYYKSLNSLSRNQCQKHLLVEQGFDPKLTEREIMKQRGYVQVFDSGNDVWELLN